MSRISVAFVIGLVLPGLGVPLGSRPDPGRTIWDASARGLVRVEPTIARLQYGGGGDWYASPSSIANLLAAIRERTGLPVAAREAVVTPLDPALRDHPFLQLLENEPGILPVL